MSSILKALKKLEDEKSPSQEEKTLNVSRDILKQSTGSGIAGRWIWFFGSAAALIIVILVVALMRKPSVTEAVRPRELPAFSQPAPVQTLPPSPLATGSDYRAATVTPAPVNSLKTELAPQLLPPRAKVSIKSEPLELPGSAAPPGEPMQTAPTRKSPPVLATVASDATLTLSGIAWNKDSADRLAIINGQPTATGATINGVLVDEILPDRVKLSRKGRTFELLIGRSAATD